MLNIQSFNQFKGKDGWCKPELMCFNSNSCHCIDVDDGNYGAKGR